MTCMDDQSLAARASTDVFDPATARAVVDDAIARYFESRRERVPQFVDRNFGFRGSASLHGKAIGWDLARAPINVALIPLQAGAYLGGAIASGMKAPRAASWLRSRHFLLRTDVDREIEWRIWTDLLELPHQMDQRISTRDALAEIMMQDPRLHAAISEPLAEIARHADEPDTRARIERTIAAYTGTRAAAADITGALISAGAGYMAAQQITPSMWTLGPVLAATLANHAAIGAFPLGATLGHVWYSTFPIAAGPAFTVGVTAGLAAFGAVIVAFAGILADPAQKALGLHQHRLKKMLSTLERRFRGDASADFAPRDHYVARLVDLVDIVRVAHKVALGG